MTSRKVVVHSNAEILGGTPVFVGTRVPLKNLFGYLERGHDLDEFSMLSRLAVSGVMSSSELRMWPSGQLRCSSAQVSFQ
jgi:hypothetical protein